MIPYLQLFFRLLYVKVQAQYQYRFSFWLDILTTFVTNGVAFISLILVLQRVPQIGGWTLPELALLYGMVELPFGLMDMIFSGFDPPLFGRYVRLGLFDQMLLKPVPIFLQVLSSEFFLRRLGRILQGGIVLVMAILWTAPHWTIIKFLYLLVILIAQVCFYGGLFIFGSALTFWTIEPVEVINIFTYGGTELTAYPMHIYPDWLVRFFTYIVPAIFLTYYPALFILDKPDPFGLPTFSPFLSPLIGVIFLGLGMASWNSGLRHYQSTGS